MILEVAILNIKQSKSAEFEAVFKKAQLIISSMPGYISHELQKCIEQENKYILLVHWEKLEDHTKGFRESSEYLIWKEVLHHFYEPFPEVEHYQMIVNGREE
ncbi:Uncharacterized protein YczJ [hydrothermal vent metagenome]|uniref:Uncharacterized protein YczJ n=1 Tax=hydrothermal vent metagenome TaxID=652676 RepID=A0A3B0YGC7_9ZZZZ